MFRPKFCIDDIKYVDIKDARYILIRGWGFIEEEMFCNFNVKVNEQKFPITLKRVKRLDVQEACKCLNAFTGFIIRISLDNVNIETLKMFINNDKERSLILTLTKSQLEEIRDTTPVSSHIDHFFYDKNNDCADVYGFALSKAGKKIKTTITDNKGNNIQFKLDKIKRSDLVKHYVVNEEDVECGFNITFEDFSPDLTYAIHFSCDGFEETKILELEEDYMTKSSKINMKKSFNYIHDNGLVKFLKKSKTGSLDDDLEYNEWRKMFIPSKKSLKLQRKTNFEYAPKISLVVATFNTPIQYLKEMIDTVVAQTYPNWELCIADGSSTCGVVEYIRENYNKGRIVLTRLDKNLGIAGNMNEAIKIASGDYIGLYDHDDFIEPNALYEYVKILNGHRNAKVIYSDEDKVDSNGRVYFQPHFKPDFNLDLLRSGNYITHFLVVSRDVIDEIGLLDSKYDGAQDYDFILRCAEHVMLADIYHVPQILYHWRMHRDSTAGNPESKLYAYEAGTRALQAHYDRLGIAAKVEREDFLGNYRTHYLLENHPKVSIIIPNRDNVEILRRCIQSIVTKATYDNYEIIIVENNSTEDSTYEYYNFLNCYKFVKVIYDKPGFNYSEYINDGVHQASGDYFLFMHNDTEVIAPNFIEEMLGCCMRKDVGVVGTRLFFDDDSIQHGGIILGSDGTIHNCFENAVSYDHIYQNRLLVAQNYSAVSGACMMTSREAFSEVNGFSEDYKILCSDVDYCLKIQDKGYLVIYTPFAKVLHRELNSVKNVIGYERMRQEDSSNFKARWSSRFKAGDPHYNPNLKVDGARFALKVL